MAGIEGIELGRFGIYSFDFEHLAASQMRESIQALEDQGWRAFWFPELLGREALTHAGYLLSCTEEMTIVNAIAQVWPRQPQWTFGGSLLLADAYPNRYVLGLGFGGAPQPDTTPLRTMREYLDEMDAVETPNPRPQAPLRRILAAYGPKMLALGRDRTDGVLTYHVNVAHTVGAREILGTDAFLGVEHAVLFETDPERARAAAREHLVPYLATPYNIAKFQRLGYTEQDLGNGGSDRFVDDLVFWGSPGAIAEKLSGHLDAGADHVAVQVIGVESPMSHWQLLAERLLPGIGVA
jgi:probable F420-dependent oxidoreductase